MLDPAANFTVLYNFDQGGGHNPVGGLARDSDGNLYGTAIDGGASNWGTAFMFSSTGKFPVLHDFSGTDGENPQGAVTLDSSGNPTVPPTSEAPDAGAQCSRFPGNSACLAYQSPTADIADVSTH